MCVCRLKGGGQYGYRYRAIAFPQDVQAIVDQLPRVPKDAKLLLVRKQGLNNTHKDFKVRRSVIADALIWLQANNPQYADITIRWDHSERPPEDGVPDDLEEEIHEGEVGKPMNLLLTRIERWSRVTPW